MAIDSKLQSLLSTLGTANTKLESYLSGSLTQACVWMMPPTQLAWDGNPLNIPGMADAFESQAADTPDEQACNAITSGGAIATASGNSLQMSLLGSMQRSFVLRHMTPVRALQHVSGRAGAHGIADGVLLGGVPNYVQNILDAANTA
jgi:hypothetical protein